MDRVAPRPPREASPPGAEEGHEDRARRLVGPLRERLEAARRDWIVGAVLVVLLTPLGLALAAAGLGLALAMSDLPWGTDGLFGSSSLGGKVLLAQALLGYMGVALLDRDPRALRPAPLAVAAAALAAMVALHLGTSLLASRPGAFFALEGLLALAYLAALGGGYAPRDDYYLGWTKLRLDDPFASHDDRDRAHQALGFAVAVPTLIVGSYADVVASRDLLRAALDEREALAGARLLAALERGDVDGAGRAVGALGATAGARVVRALEHARVVQVIRGGARLTPAGRRFLLATAAGPPAQEA